MKIISFRFSYKNLENPQNKNIVILFQNKSLAELSKISFFVVMERNGTEVFKRNFLSVTFQAIKQRRW